MTESVMSPMLFARRCDLVSAEWGADGSGTGTRMPSQDWLTQFAAAARSVTFESPSAMNVSVFASRVGIAALERFGVAAQVVPVYVHVYNAEAWEQVQAGTPMTLWPSNAHAVGITEHTLLESRYGWNGHVVVLVEGSGGRRVLVDLSADKFDRPIRNLSVGGPVVVAVPGGPRWTVRDAVHAEVASGEGQGAVVSYRPMPADREGAQRWQVSRDWQVPTKVLDGLVCQITDRSPPR